MKRKYIFKGIDDLIINASDINNKVYSIGLCLNSPCTYNCIYCYAKDGIIHNEDGMSLHDYFDTIKQAKALGCQSVMITGVSSPSEPLLSPYLLDIVCFISQQDMTSVIFTNANTLGNDQVCKRLYGITSQQLSRLLYLNNASLMISCDSINEENYNRIVGTPGQFKWFATAVENLISAGYIGQRIHDNYITRIAISSVISKTNILELKTICDFAHRNKWQYICKFPALVGNAKTNIDMFFSPEEVKRLRSEVYQIPDKYETSTVLDSSGKEYCLSNQLGMAINGCGQPLSCLSGHLFLGDDITVMNTPLNQIFNMKHEMFGAITGRCLKKKEYYFDI